MRSTRTAGLSRPIRSGTPERPEVPARRSTHGPAPDAGSTAARLLALQRTAGNAAVRHLMRDIDRQRAKKDFCVGETVDAARAQTVFTPAQSQILRVVRQAAVRVCSNAAVAVDMPGNEASVVRVARDYFGVTIRMSARTRRTLARSIRSVERALIEAPIHAGTCQDEHCNGGAVAHVDEARTMIVLCPRFFNPDLHPVATTVRMLIHEAAHLAKLDANAEKPWLETYCSEGASKTERCPVPDAIHNVDAWSHVIDDLAATV
jgi:hypothetical protein